MGVMDGHHYRGLMIQGGTVQLNLDLALCMNDKVEYAR